MQVFKDLKRSALVVMLKILRSLLGYQTTQNDLRESVCFMAGSLALKAGLEVLSFSS